MIPGQCLPCKHQDLCLLPNTHGKRRAWQSILVIAHWVGKDRWIPEALVSQPSQWIPGPSQRPSHNTRWIAPEESDPKLILGLCTQRDAVEQRNTPIYPLTHFVKSQWRSNYHYTKSDLLELKWLFLHGYCMSLSLFYIIIVFREVYTFPQGVFWTCFLSFAPK